MLLDYKSHCLSPLTLLAEVAGFAVQLCGKLHVAQPYLKYIESSKHEEFPLDSFLYWLNMQDEIQKQVFVLVSTNELNEEGLSHL